MANITTRPYRSGRLSARTPFVATTIQTSASRSQEHREVSVRFCLDVEEGADTMRLEMTPDEALELARKLTFRAEWAKRDTGCHSCGVDKGEQHKSWCAQAGEVA